MRDLFQRFSDEACRLIVLAQDEAQTLRQGRVGAQHMLMGMLAEPVGVTATVLSSFGVEPRALRAALYRNADRGDRRPYDVPDVGDDVAALLVDAMARAAHAGHNHVGTGHILLALVATPGPLVAQALRPAGLVPEAVDPVLARLTPERPDPNWASDAPGPEEGDVELVLRVRPEDIDLLMVDGQGGERVLGPDHAVYRLLHGFVSESADLARGLRGLEQMLAAPGVREAELQHLLEDHPSLLRSLGYVDAVPHLALETDDQRLIPDFVLRGVGADPLYDLVELKLPEVSLLTFQAGRPQFTRRVAAGVSQLMDYAAALDQPAVRTRVQERYGIEIFKPGLHLVIGRSRGLQRASLLRAAGLDGGRLRISTWDDVVDHARHRLGRT